MQLAGAERGRVRLRSEPLTAIVVTTAADGTPEGDPPEVLARLLWVPPKVETICRQAAFIYLRTLSGGEPTAEDAQQETQRLMLSWALRRDDGVYKTQVYPFPDILQDGLRLKPAARIYDALYDAAVRTTCPHADELWAAYQTFAAAEFPPFLTDAQWRDLVTAGKESTLETLALRDDFWQILRALPGLVVGYRRSGGSSGIAGRL